MSAADEIKLYFDYKSPFAYLAAAPAFALPERYAVAVRWIPFTLRIKGRGERSEYSEWKARYSYMDARRWANQRGGFPTKGPPKVYDSSPALIGGLFAETYGFFRPYTETVFSRFFDRTLEIDLVHDIAAVVDGLGHPGTEYTAYQAGQGRVDFERASAEAHADHLFGVPLFVFRGEQFWGHDRLPLLEDRLVEAGFRR